MTDDESDRERSLNHAIAEYTRRLDDGDSVDRDAFLREHADFADELQEHFDNLDFAQSLAAHMGSQALRDTRIVENTDQVSRTGAATDGLTDSQRQGATPFGPFRIESVLGQGGMGVVYLATELALNRKVALKLPTLTDDDTGAARKRFHREAQLAANLNHPNICPLFSFGDVDGVYYICMPVVTGRPLSDLLQRPNPARPDAMLRLVRKIALAVGAAHEAGIVHRDLKPANIMLDDRHEPMILDFGLAAPPPDLRSEDITRPGAVAGTPQYMAPEQLFPALGDVGPATDVFALGIILYELLVGERPFRNGAMDVLAATGDEEIFQRPSERRPGIDPRIDEICSAMLCRDPKQRCAGMPDVADSFTEILGDSQAAGSQSETADGASGPSTKQRRSAALGRRARQAAKAKTLPRRSTRKRRTTAQRNKQASNPKLIAGIIAALALLILAGLWKAGIIFKVETEHGMLVVRITDQRFMASAVGGTVTILNTETDEKQTVTLTGVETSTPNLKTGDYKFLLETDSGLKTRTDRFTIGSDEPAMVEVWWEPALKLAEHVWPADAPPPAIAPLDESQARELQERWAAYLEVPVERDVDLGNGVHLGMVLIPPGEFLMGSSKEQATRVQHLATEAGHKTPPVDMVQQPVRIAEPFWMSRYEITVGQYRRFVEETGFTTRAEQDGIGGWGFLDNKPKKSRQFMWSELGFTQTPRHPVVNVCREDTVAFCRWLSQHRGEFELPTEAHWEYACRAGSTGIWHWGDEIDRLPEHGWFNGKSRRPHPVGQLQPNPWNLYDMYGNVWEWCATPGQPDIDLAETAAAGVPSESGTGTSLGIRRGGCWSFGMIHGRSASRKPTNPQLSDFQLGFRVMARAARPHLPPRTVDTAPSTMTIDEVEEIPLVNDTETFRDFVEASDGASVYTPEHLNLCRRLRTETGEQRTQTLEEIANLEWTADRFQRDRIPRDVLAAAGWGDADKAPPEIVALLGDPRLSCWAKAYYVCFTDAGRTIVVTHADGTLSFHQASSGRLLDIRKCHDAPIIFVDASPDARFYVTGCDNGAVSLWDRQSGRQLATYADHTARISEVRFSSKGDMFATSSLDGTVCVYSLQSPAKPIHVLKHGQPAYDVEFVRNGELIASASHDEKLRIWRSGTGELVKELSAHPGIIRKLDRNESGELLASLDLTGKVVLWNTQDWEVVRSLQTTSNTSPMMVISRDGKFLVNREGDSALCLWDLESGLVKKTWSCSSNTYPTRIDPNGRFVVSTNRTERICIRDFSAETDRFSSPHPMFRPKSELSQDGTQLILAGTGIDLHAWDLNTHSLNLVQATRPGMVCVAVSADGRQLATAGTTWKPAVFDTKTGKLINHPKRGHTNIVHAVAYSHDGSMIASGASDRYLWIWDRKTMKGKGIRCDGSHRIRSVAFSPDDKLIALGDKVGGVQIRNAQDGALVAAFDGKVGECYAVRFTPDGRRVVQGTGDGVIKIWDLDAMKLVAELKGHSRTVFSLKFSRDDRMLASSSYDGSIILWDAQTGKAIRTIELYPFGFGHVYLAGFTPDNRHLIATGRNGLVYVLRLKQADAP